MNATRSALCTYLLSWLKYHVMSINTNTRRGDDFQDTLHKLEGAYWLAELLSLMYVFNGIVKGRLHQAYTQWSITILEKPQRLWRTYPRGPPLRTSRSRSSPDISTFTPPSTGPSTFASGTKHSSKTSSHVSLPRIPTLSSFCAVENPGMPFSIRNAVIPLGPADGVVLA